MFTHSTVITGLKHVISPYFGIVWVLFYNTSDFLWKSALNLEIWAENRENFNKVGDVSDPETEEQMLVSMGLRKEPLRKCVMTPWIFNEL